jgi:hypothetical protein
VCDEVVLYAFWTSGGAILFSNSSDGLTWSAPNVLCPGARLLSLMS